MTFTEAIWALKKLSVNFIFTLYSKKFFQIFLSTLKYLFKLSAVADELVGS
jgi:hypothetical protein